MYKLLYTYYNNAFKIIDNTLLKRNIVLVYVGNVRLNHSEPNSALLLLK